MGIKRTKNNEARGICMLEISLTLFWSMENPRKNLNQNGGYNVEDFSSNKLMIIFWVNYCLVYIVESTDVTSSAVETPIWRLVPLM